MIIFFASQHAAAQTGDVYDQNELPQQQQTLSTRSLPPTPGIKPDPHMPVRTMQRTGTAIVGARNSVSIKSTDAGIVHRPAAPSTLLSPLPPLPQSGTNCINCGIIDFINTVLVPLVFAIALAFFIYGVFVFLIQKGRDSSERDKGKMYMLWAIIALVVMVSLWGVVNLLAGGLGFGDTESQTIDTLIQQAPVD